MSRIDPATCTRIATLATAVPGSVWTRLTFVHAGFERTTDISDYGFGWPWFRTPLTDAVKKLTRKPSRLYPNGFGR